MNKHMHITICVPAYKRQVLFKQCITSLKAIQIPPNVKVSLIVIDNDPDKTLNDIFNQITQGLAYDTYYFCEENRGIAFARNRCIEEANNLHADYIAFIDSDNTVDINWLKSIYSFICHLSTPAVISGTIHMIIPDNASRLCKLAYKTDNNKHMELKPIKRCGTANSIIPINIINQHNLRFDTTHALASGTDTLFFLTITNLGYPIYRCNDAVVCEHLPINRCSLRYFMKVSFNGGISSYHHKRLFNFSSSKIFIDALSDLIVNAIKIPLYLIGFRWQKLLRKFLQSIHRVGRICAVFGVNNTLYGGSEAIADIKQ